jgi:hypothetical protein
MADAEAQAIADNAAAPKRVKGDEGEFEQHSIKDQIEADRYRRSVDGVSTNPRRGLRFNKIVAGGA